MKQFLTPALNLTLNTTRLIVMELMSLSSKSQIALVMVIIVIGAGAVAGFTL